MSILNSKLITIFRSLTHKEIKQLELFLDSPIHNKNDKAKALFIILKKEYDNIILSENDKSIEIPSLSKEKLQQILLPGKNEANFRVLMSQLTNLIEDFLALQEYQEDHRLKKRLSLQAFSVKQLNHFYDSTLNRLSDNYTYVPEQQDANYFYHQLNIAELNFINNMRYKNRSVSDDLSIVMQKLDTYYTFSKLRYVCAMINRQIVLAEKYSPRLLEQVLELIENRVFDNEPLIDLYYYSYLLFTKPDDGKKNFSMLRELLVENQTDISKDEVRHLYITLCNYCSQKYRKGDKLYLLELFDLYKEMIDNKIVLSGEKSIAPPLYKNICTVAIKLKEHDFAKKFITDFKKYLPSNVVETTYLLSLAHICFCAKQYDQTLKLLLDFKSTDVYDFFHYRVLQIKSFYELKEYEVMKSIAEALRIYLFNFKGLSETNKQGYTNFTKVMLKLYKVKAVKSKTVQEVINDIENYEQMVEREWLMEKVLE